MAGNVWEWTSDWYDSDYYDTVPSRNPIGPESGVLRVVRGGSWLNSLYDVRTTSRYGDDPIDWNDFVGFRLVLHKTVKED